jgi:hypothetical protein
MYIFFYKEAHDSDVNCYCKKAQACDVNFYCKEAQIRDVKFHFCELEVPVVLTLNYPVFYCKEA